MRKTLFSSLIAIFVFFATQPAFAHFHYEAELKTLLQNNKNGELSALKISWTYDPEVSEMMLSDSDDLKSFSDHLIKDLAKLNYFTELKLNGKPLKTTAVKTYHLEKLGKGKKDPTRLKLTITLPLKSPISLKGKNALTLDHTDPSGSAILYYETPNSIHFDKQLEPNCIATIEEIKDFKHGQSPQNVIVVCEVP